MNTEKKQWIMPEATEIEVNNGTHKVHSYETDYHFGLPSSS